MIFRLIGLIKTLVWPSSSEIAVISIGHVFKKSAIYKRQYKFTCLQKQDKLLKYKCEVNVYQEHNSIISCYKFIFNQTIDCQMSQKNLLLLMLSCTITFVTIEGSIGTGSW